MVCSLHHLWWVLVIGAGWMRTGSVLSCTNVAFIMTGYNSCVFSCSRGENWVLICSELVVKDISFLTFCGLHWVFCHINIMCYSVFMDHWMSIVRCDVPVKCEALFPCRVNTTLLLLFSLCSWCWTPRQCACPGYRWVKKGYREMLRASLRCVSVPAASSSSPRQGSPPHAARIRSAKKKK